MAFEIDPSGIARQLAVAVTDYQEGRSASALGQLRALARTYPEQAAPASVLGAALCNEGRFAEGAEALERAVLLDPTDPIAKAYLGVALLRSRFDVEAARTLMEQAVALGPQRFVVRWKSGEFLLRLGYAREAAAELQAALQTDAPDAGSRAACAAMLRVAEKRGVKQHNRIAPGLPTIGLPSLFQRLLIWRELALRSKGGLAVALLMLPALSLLFMVMRVWLPFGQQTQGNLLLEIRLSWRERLLFQRTNLYAFGALLLLLTATGSLPLVLELIAIAFAYGVLTLPVRYRFTNQGVGLNNVVFRRWDEFHGLTVGARSIRLQGNDGMADFQVRVGADHQAPALALLRQHMVLAENPLERKEGTTIHLKRPRRGGCDPVT